VYNPNFSKKLGLFYNYRSDYQILYVWHHSMIYDSMDKLQGKFPNIAMNIQKLTLMTIASISIVTCCRSSPSLASDIELNSKTCRVTDPTGTPLNVRLSPNGKVVSKIRNQTVVYPQSINYDDAGKPWLLINVRQPGGDKMLGWVVREFVSCYQ
jgi:hypothetical protein